MRVIPAGVIGVLAVLVGGGADAAPGDRVGQGEVLVGEQEKVHDAVAFGGPLTVRGWVTGDAVAFGGDVRLLPGARVDGDLTAFGGRVLVEPGAAAQGHRVGFGEGESGDTWVPSLTSASASVLGHSWTEKVRAAWSRLGQMLGLYVLLVLLGVVMLGVAPLRTRALAAAVATHPGKSLGLGVLVMVGALAAALFLAVTVVGIPLALVLAAVVACAAGVGLTGVSILVGELLPLPALRDRQLVKLMLGAGLLVLALAIPYVGGLVGCVATLVGLGSLAFTRLRPGHAVFLGQGPYRSAPML